MHWCAFSSKLLSLSGVWLGEMVEGWYGFKFKFTVRVSSGGNFGMADKFDKKFFIESSGVRN